MPNYKTKIIIKVLYLFLGATIGISPHLMAQCNNYECKMDLARKSFSNGNYQDALSHARGALNYGGANEQEVSIFINRVFDEIDDKLKQLAKREKYAEEAQQLIADERAKVNEARLEAEKLKALADSLKSEAVNAQKLAESNLAFAQKQQAEAEKAKEEVIIMQTELRTVSEKILDLYIKEINDHILKLEYEKANAKLMEAASIKLNTPAFLEVVVEMAFWWNENKSQILAFELLKKALGVSVSLNHKSIEGFLSKNYPSQYNAVLEKYFGEMISVQGGKFAFEGKKIAEVDNFKLAEKETTFWQFNLYCQNNFKSIDDFQEKQWGDIKGHDPIINISWYEAIRYANWLSERFKLQAVYEILGTDNVEVRREANGFRLPYETEWAFAAMAGNSYKYAGSNNLTDVASKIGVRTQPVGFKKPNNWGFYDMTGNVWEWCNDWYATYPKNPPKNYAALKKTQSTQRKTVRGGAWNQVIKVDTRSAYRIKSYPGVTKNNIGFRIAQNN